MSGCRINSVYVGISGSHIKGQNSLSIVSVKGREVDEGDVQRAIEASKAIAIPVGREIMHILPQSYVIDGQEGIKDSNRNVRCPAGSKSPHCYRSHLRHPGHCKIPSTG